MSVGPIHAPLPSTSEIVSAPGNASGTGFARALDQALESVTAPTRAGDQAVQELVLGRTDNLHQVLLTVAQADLAFRLLLEIRNRLTEAYQEIQRMQV